LALRKALAILLGFLLLVPLIGFLSFSDISSVEASSVIDTSVSQGTAYFFGRKTFYTNGRWWIIYNDGINFRWKTSVDGASWSASAIFRATNHAMGNVMDTWLEFRGGVYYIHYAYAEWLNTDDVFYRRGELETDGTISWSAVEQVISIGGANDDPGHPFVSVNTDGYPFIAYNIHDSVGGTELPGVVWSSTNDGTFTEAGEINIHVTSVGYLYPVIVPLTANKMFAGCFEDSVGFVGRVWNGIAWEAKETIVADPNVVGQHSMSAWGDDVYVSYKDASDDLILTKRSWGVGWDAGVTIKSATDNNQAHILTKSATPDEFYIIYMDDAGKMYYKYRNDDASLESETLIFSDTNILDSSVMGSYQIEDSRISIAYTKGVGSPYTVMLEPWTLGSEEAGDIVGTTTDIFATRDPNMHKNYHASGRFWVWYSDGTNMGFKTSVDGDSWSGFTNVKAENRGVDFSVHYDGTYIHYVQTVGTDPYNLVYRRGVCNADGTITWSAVEQLVVADIGTGITHPSIGADNESYPWIGYRYHNGDWYPRIIASSTNDGTWNTALGFPYTSRSGDFSVTVISLTNKRMGMIMGNYSWPVLFRFWDGSSWGAEENATTFDIQYGGYLSATSLDDNVHLAVLRGDVSNITYVTRINSTGTWENETLIVGGLTITSAPVISIDDWSEEIFVFWTHNNHIYYRKNVRGTWLDSVDWLVESSESITGNQVLTSSYKEFGTTTRYIGLVYMTNGSYNVKFASRAIYRNVNVTITNMEGCGNWLFAEERHYDFLAYYTGIDFDILEIAFSDGENWINASYSVVDDVFRLTSGSDFVRLADGGTSLVDTTLGVTFKLYITDKIFDAFDVDIYMRSNKTDGDSTGWELKEADYFNIYNLGGYTESDGTGVFLHLTGESPWDWKVGPSAGATASAELNMTLRNIQSVRWKSSLFAHGDASAKGQGFVEFGFYFCDDLDVWTKGINVRLTITDWELLWGSNSMEFQVDWYEGDVFIKQDFIYGFYEATTIMTLTRFSVDLWVDAENASTTFGGHVNPLYFDRANWFGAGAGGNYISQFQCEIINSNSDLISTKDIKMWKAYVYLNKSAGAGADDYWATQETMFNYLNREAKGIDHPTFLEPIVYVKTGGYGFLEPIRQGIIALGSIIVDGMTVTMLNGFTIFTGFLDTLFSFAGWPGGFSAILVWISSFLTWTVDAINYTLSLLTSTFLLMASWLTFGIGWFATFATGFVTIFDVLTSIWTQAQGGWFDITSVLTPLMPLIPLALFVWLLSCRTIEGVVVRVKLLIDMVQTAILFLLKIGSYAFDLISKLINLIPVIE